MKFRSFSSLTYTIDCGELQYTKKLKLTVGLVTSAFGIKEASIKFNNKRISMQLNSFHKLCGTIIIFYSTTTKIF
ncbi:unnamed protein product [Rotaria socialis]